MYDNNKKVLLYKHWKVLRCFFFKKLVKVEFFFYKGEIIRDVNFRPLSIPFSNCF